MAWHVWIQSREFNGAMSYIYPFTVYDENVSDAEAAVDYVLGHYCATHDGQRFLNDPLTRLSSAWVAPSDQVTEVGIKAIDQPVYERDPRHHA